MAVPLSLKNRIVREYEVEIVTPMYLGSEDGIHAMLRTYPWKGLLRYWWRATSTISNSRKLFERESEIFGSTEEKSKVTIQIVRSGVRKASGKLEIGPQFTVTKENRNFRLYILGYLNYGVYDKPDRGQNREYLEPGGTFTLRLIFDNAEVEKEVNRALSALVQYGGLGAKAKNGFGCVFIRNFQPLKFSFESYGDLRSFPSFSNQAKVVYLSKEYSSWYEALGDIGLRYRNARISLEKPFSYHIRLHLAGPLIAHNANPSRIRGDRLAKSLFLHVDKLPSGRYRGKILFMPYGIPGNKQAYLDAYRRLIDNL